MTKTETTPETTFERDLERLEELVRLLESGEQPLADALQAFEEGVALTRACRARLERVEGRVAELLANGETRTVAGGDE